MAVAEVAPRLVAALWKRVVIAVAIGLLAWATWAKRGGGVAVTEAVLCGVVALLLVAVPAGTIAWAVVRPVWYGVLNALVGVVLTLATNCWFHSDYSTVRSVVWAAFFGLWMGVSMGWWMRSRVK